MGRNLPALLESRDDTVAYNGEALIEIYCLLSDPWVVFFDVESRWHSRLEDKGSIKYTIYAFTFLSRVSNSKRVSRRAGTGTWGGQTGLKMIQDSKSGQIIGQSKMLAFEHRASDADFGHWTMNEYSLSDDLIRSSGLANAADVVVCKITKTVKKKKKNNKKSGAQPPLAEISKLPELWTTEMFLPVIGEVSAANPESQSNSVWVQPPRIVNHAAVRDPFDVSVPDSNQQDEKTSGAGEGSEVEPNDDEDLSTFEAELERGIMANDDDESTNDNDNDDLSTFEAELENMLDDK
ncbi:hypothetical protein SASPL_121730 [Salvia splendens]|uniref:NAC domain-containing protein n=1 Tax=Salvia splendens TaxID=180675 RepID=A0A8X8XX18_SALSN|nr:hypothetical protein SASPL_121730 [Salvia splendens]